MPNEKESVADFLNEISTNKEPFAEESTEAEEPAGEEEFEEEKPLPFHKDPKVQRYVEKQIEKALKNQPTVEQQFKRDVEEDIKLPSSFVRLIGNDTPEKVEVLKDMSRYFQTLKGEARQEFLDELKAQESVAREQDEAALSELEEGFEEINDIYGVDLDSDSKTRGAFVEYLRKVSHKNSDGEVDQFPDIPATWEAFQAAQKPRASQNTRAKELAARGLTRSSDADTSPKRPSSWRDVDKFIQSLSN